MITAARLIAHKTINGKYQSHMQLDQMDALGLQMTHSIDSIITDSANSASALYTGKKTSVDALGVWGDSVRRFLFFPLALRRLIMLDAGVLRDVLLYLLVVVVMLFSRNLLSTTRRPRRLGSCLGVGRGDRWGL